MSVTDVIIPVYLPDKRLEKILYALSKQSARVRSVILMRTVADGEDVTRYERLKERYLFLEVYDVDKESFDHAATRNEGISHIGEDTTHFLLMTQDAVPADAFVVERLHGALAVKDEKGVRAVAYARQIAGKDAPIEERCQRAFNYPKTSSVRSYDDIDRYGIKTFFCSNVCALYDRKIFEETGPFKAPAVFNEDMVYAAAALKKGYAVAYAADAVVIHRHDDSLKERFLRNRAMGRSQAENPLIFGAVSSEKEGMKLVKFTVRQLVRSGKAYRVPYFILQCAARYAGYLTGKIMG